MSGPVKALLGLLVTLAMGWIVHGPMGAGTRLVDGLERQVDAVVDRQGVPGVAASLGRDPLSRHVSLAGPADDFQRRGFSDLVRPVEGIAGVRWLSQPRAGNESGRNPAS